MSVKVKFTSEELKGMDKQPEDSCPHLNEIIEHISINKNKNNLSERCFSSLQNAKDVIIRISSWAEKWKNELDSNSDLVSDDPFVDAYLETADFHKNENLHFDINKEITNINCNIENYEEGLKEYLEKPLGFDESSHNDYMNYKKETILKSVEHIRNYAKNERSVGQNYKDAYKNISIELDLNDIIQPYEIINEEQGFKNNIINLGILHHEKTFKEMERIGLLEEHQSAMFSILNKEQIESVIFESVKKEHPDTESIVYFKDLESFQQNKGYDVKRTNKLENKNTNRRKL